MRMSRPFVLAVAVAALAGCGRGGSSGLDIASENRVIDAALRRQRCQDYRGLTICPADASGTASGPRIDTGLANATAIDCFQATPGGACTFTLTFTPQSFAAGTTFNVLGRSDSAGSPWILGTDPLPSGGASMTATVALTVNAAAPPRVQLAVLAFAAASQAPGEVEQLHDTAATYAFVTRVLDVNVVTPTPTATATGRPTNTATATQTPGAGDCCQCEASCAEPIDGSCGDCAVVLHAACFGGLLCTARTPTPTATPVPTSASCFSDGGDGTIVDRCTGLTWEKKVAAAGLHDYGVRYLWSGVCNHDLHRSCQPDAEAAALCAQQTDDAYGCEQCPSDMVCIDFAHGSERDPTETVWTWLADLNRGEGFAGHTDWRLPTVGKDGASAELESLLLPICPGDDACIAAAFNEHCEPGEICGDTRPCADGSTCLHRPNRPDSMCQGTCTAASCSCTWPQRYWSRSDDSSGSPADHAWYLDFLVGSVASDDKAEVAAVRAVRGESTTPLPTPPPTSGATVTPTPCYADNGDGTITDTCLGLRWEKKDRAGGLHDDDARFTWAGACSGESALCQPSVEAAATCRQQTGGDEGCAVCDVGTCIVDPDHQGASATVWEWINQLNASAFAGFNDWRIPTVGQQGDAAELDTICPVDGIIPRVFNDGCTAGCGVASCSCTLLTNDPYWSATSLAFQPGFAVGTNCGGGAGPKTNAFAVRAVRRDF